MGFYKVAYALLSLESCGIGRAFVTALGKHEYTMKPTFKGNQIAGKLTSIRG